MANFDTKSRYVKHATIYEVKDRRGRIVKALTAALPGTQTKLGEHLHQQGQRLDHLANHYFSDASGFWRLAELNDAVLPDAVLTQDVIKIPSRTR
jgi:hypothetical protein